MRDKKLTVLPFQNGSNKVAIELRVVQFWSEIILVISNHAYDFRPNCTPLSSITIIYYLKQCQIVVCKLKSVLVCINFMHHDASMAKCDNG